MSDPVVVSKTIYLPYGNAIFNVANAARIICRYNIITFQFGNKTHPVKFDSNTAAFIEYSKIKDTINYEAPDMWFEINDITSTDDIGNYNFVNLMAASAIIKPREVKRLEIYSKDTVFRYEFSNQEDRDGMYEDLLAFVLAFPETKWAEDGTETKIFNIADIIMIRKVENTRICLTISDSVEYTLPFVDKATRDTVFLAYTTAADDTTNAAPVAADVAFTPTEDLAVGVELTGTHNYVDAEGDVEDGVTLEWYRASDAEGSDRELIADESTATYFVKADDIGKFISFAVTPYAETGRIDGATAFSPFIAVAGISGVIAALVVPVGETELDGAQITLTLLDEGAAFSETPDVGDFELVDAPAGTTIDSVEYVDETTLTVTLAYDGTDYDVDQKIAIAINADAAITGGPSGTVTTSRFSVPASVETVSVNVAGNLTEMELDGLTLTLIISHHGYIEGALATNKFTLNNAPAGLTVDSFAYINAASVQITLAFDGTSFDEDINDFSITISGDIITNGNPVSTSDLELTAAVAVATPLVALFDINLDGAVVNIELVNEAFANSSLDKTKFTLENAPDGVTVIGVEFISSTEAVVTLGYDGTPILAPVADFAITIDETELNNGAYPMTTSAMTIQLD